MRTGRPEAQPLRAGRIADHGALASLRGRCGCRNLGGRINGPGRGQNGRRDAGARRWSSDTSLGALFELFVVLVVVVDPIGNVPLFMALTASMDATQRRRTAVRAVTLAGAILLLFFWAGDWLLAILGIGIPAFRIAGGILLLLLAIDMVLVRQSGLRSTTLREEREAFAREDVHVFPLAFPLVAGPGAITTVLLAAAAPRDLVISLGMMGVMVAVLLVVLVAMLLADRLMGVLGETGANVITRLLGVLLAALAVQYVLDGLREVFVESI